MFGIQKTFSSFQLETDERSGINVIDNMRSFSHYKGMTDLKFDSSNYSVHERHHSKYSFAFKSNENEELKLSRGLLKHNKDLKSETSSQIQLSNDELRKILNSKLNASNTNWVKLRECRQVKSTKFSLKETEDGNHVIQEEVTRPKRQCFEITPEYEIDLKDFSTNKTEKLTEMEVIRLINEETLQKLIFDCDYDGIASTINQFESDTTLISRLINNEDLRGNHPLFLCIYLREIYKDDEEKRNAILRIIQLFLTHGLKIRIRNDEKRTPLEEAISYADKELVEIIYNQALINKNKRVQVSKTKAESFLLQIPDFYIEIKWEVNVPLFSYMCPKDTCLIWKQGNSVRMDYTFIKMKGLNSVRAPSSFIFSGETGQNYLINWETKKYYDQFEPLEDDEKSLIIDDLMDGARLNSEFKLRNCKFSQSLSWRGKPIFEKIDSWSTQRYDVRIGSFFDLHHNIRIDYMNMDKETYFDYNQTIKKKIQVIQSNDQTKKKIEKNLKIENELMKKQIENLGKVKEKNHSAIVWIAENYPLKFSTLANLINSLSSANEVIDKIKEFFKDPEVQNIMSKGGFPIKIKIPINFFIDVTVHFVNYKQKKSDNEFDSMFIVPDFLQKTTRKEVENIKIDYKKRLKHININL